ncbi:VanZ family protein [Klenkia sp. LSe6-5]|uniref:VanZ family protein n=1 Tax=Klenkia sesuvii TaxID=3103137 RepID=A0ABU8DXY7_9ACTN
MISTWLVENPWFAPTALLVLVVLGPVLAGVLADRRRVALFLAGLSLLPVVALTLVPSGREAFQVCAVQWAAPSWGRSGDLSNLALFVAPALLATVVWRRPLLVLLAGTVLSALVELTQALLPGLGRVCDTNDWLYNTAGSALGVGLAVLGLTVSGRLRGRSGTASRSSTPAS